MRYRTAALLVAASGLGISFLSCSPMQSAGTASGGETRTIAVRGQALYGPERPAKNIFARIRPIDYLAGRDTPVNDSLTGERYGALTDDSGFYCFQIADTGSYRIELTTLRDSAASIDCRIEERRPALIHAAQLEKTGAIKGRIDLGITAVADSSIRIFCYGLEHAAAADSAGAFVLRKLPKGTFSLHIEHRGSAIGIDLPGIQVLPDNESDLGAISLNANGCRDYHCDSLILEGILATNAAGPDIDAVAQKDPSTGRISVCNLQKQSLTLLPDAVIALTELQELYLNDNRLTKLPSDIGSLSSLRKLVCTNNFLESLPQSIQNLDSLEILLANGNQFQSLPSFSGSNRIKTIDIGNNQLAAFPQAVLSAVNLEELYLNNNAIDALPDAIASLESLRIFVAGGNRIASLPENIGGMSALRRLDISDNALDSLPSSIGSLVNCSVLYINANTLQSLPESIANLDNITLCSLSGNRLCGELPLAVIQWADSVDPRWKTTQVCE